MAFNLPQTINPSSITQNQGTAAGGLLGPPSWNTPGGGFLSSYTPGQPFSISQNVGDPSLTQGYGNYSMNPQGQYTLGSTVQPQASDAGSFLDHLIQGGSMAGLAAAGGLAGASALGGTGGATSLFGGSNPLFGAGAATSGTAPLTYGSVPGSFGGPAGAPLAGGGDLTGMGSALPGAAGAAPASTTPGLTGLTDTSALFGNPATTSGMGGPLSGIGGGPLDALNLGTGGASGLGGGALNGLNLGASGTSAGLEGSSPFSFSSLFTPGGSNSFLNTQNLGNIFGSILGGNKSSQLGQNLTGPYNTAMGNAQPAISNLLSMMNPSNFYNSQVGQNLAYSKTRDINATQSAAGRFGIGPGGVPANGQGVDAQNLLNQYMAQQYSSALQANSGATGSLLGAVNATYPGYNAGNVIGANSANPLMSLFNNPAINNAGNSALQYLWNGIG
jgi:hypothetical protein